MLRTILTHGTFPCVIVGATAGGMWLIERMHHELAIGVMGVACVVLTAALERINAYLPEYNRSHGDIVTDIVHNVVSGVAIPEATRLVGFGLLYTASAALTARVGFDLWPSGWPLLAQLALALVVAELPAYAFHRVQHASELWWRMHATHHSVPRLYWLNAGRFHPLDALASYAILMAPLVLLGVPEPTLAMVTIFITAHGLLQHSNVALAHGPLNYVFSTAELHRWHHAPTPADGNNNYGSVLIVWDLLFGTRFLPANRKAPQNIGIGSMPEFPSGYLEQLASPFTWRSLGGQDPRQ